MKGFVYQLKDNTNGNVYIGSTMSKKGLNHRRDQHKNDYKRYCNEKLNYRSSFDIIMNNDYSYEILQEFEDCCKEDLLNAECITINNFKSFNDKCVNRCIYKKRFTELQEDCGWIL